MQANLCTNLPFPVTEANKREEEGGKPYAFTNIRCYQIWKQNAALTWQVFQTMKTPLQKLSEYTQIRYQVFCLLDHKVRQNMCATGAWGDHVSLFFLLRYKGVPVPICQRNIKTRQDFYSETHFYNMQEKHGLTSTW